MAAGKHNFICEQGATWSRTITVTDADDDARDLSDYTARMMVRPHITSDTVLVSLRTGGHGIVITGPTGVITLTLTAAQTAALSWTRGSVYDLELIDENGAVERLLEGDFEIVPEVTKTVVESVTSEATVSASATGVVTTS
jgi:hypothetical protein